MAQYQSKGRWWLTADGARVVPEGHPAAARLYATPGQAVDAAEAKRLGLVDAEAPTVEAQAQAAPLDDTEAKPDVKAMHKPEVEDKAVDGPKAKRER